LKIELNETALFLVISLSLHSADKNSNNFMIGISFYYVIKVGLKSIILQQERGKNSVVGF